MQIKPLNSEVQKTLNKYTLWKKFKKQQTYFETNPFHPGLHTKKLEPHDVGLYSFRLDKKFRVIFRIRDDQAEILLVTNHYH